MTQRRRKAVKTPTTEIRKRALALLIEQWGGPSNLAKKLGVTPSYVSQIMSGDRTITEKGAAKIESKLNLTPGFMSTERTPESIKPARVDDSLIIKVIQHIGAHAEEAGIVIAPSKFAEVVTLVYEEALRTKSVDDDYIDRVLRLLK